MVDTKTEMVEKAINGENLDKFFEGYSKYQNQFPPDPKRRKKKVIYEKDRSSRNKKKGQSISL